MQGVPHPRVVAQDLDKGGAGVVGDQDAVGILILIEHAERVAVGNLADRIERPVVHLLAKVHGDKVTGR